MVEPPDSFYGIPIVPRIEFNELKWKFVTEYIRSKDNNFLFRSAYHYVQSILVKEKVVKGFEV